MSVDESTGASTARKILCIHRRAPYGTIYAQEGLEIALIGGAFDQRIALALIDDGVFLLRRDQDTAGLRMKQFTAGYRALGDFGIYRIYVERESLEARGMEGARLLEVPADSDDDETNLVAVVSSAELSEVIEQQDVLLNF